MLLIASSFPLHMIWNAVIFETQATNEYVAVVASENFTRGAHWTVPTKAPHLQPSTYRDIIGDLQHKVQGNELEELDPQSCHNAYGDGMIVRDRRNVAIIVDTYDEKVSSVMAVSAHQFVSSESKSIISWDGGYQVSTRDVPGIPLTKCYSEHVNEQCKVSLIPAFLIVVIVCNMVKIGSCLLALLITRTDPPLVTTGDAIQSFLKDPDPYTNGRCLVAKSDYDTYKNLLPVKSQEWNPRPATTGDTWTGGRDRWLLASSTTCLAILWVTMVAIGFWGIARGFSNGTGGLNRLRLGGLWSAFAYANSGGIKLPRKSHFIAFFLPVNLPQVRVSYIYLGLNNVVSTMLAMDEWCGYSTASQKPAKGLRVSSPLPNTEQRSTYFLSVPYKWGIPPTVIIAVIHWLVSEVMNITQIDVYGIGTSTSTQTTSTNYLFLGTTPLWSAVGLGFVGMCAFFLLFSKMKYPTAMPLAGCCSASIAAACQPSGPLEEDSSQGSEFPRDLSHQKLKWGVVQMPEQAEHGIGHATLLPVK